MVRITHIAAAALVALASPAVAQDTAQATLPSGLQPGETLLRVQAQGRIFFRPDMATISAGVVSTGVTAREATDANARTMAAVIAAVRKAGVDARYIRTQQINVQPRFARSSPNDYEGQAQITGYVARNSVGVTVMKLDTAPNVIAEAFGAGANSVSGPNLSFSDPDVGMSKARADAVANARAEAEEYAKAFGLRIVRVLRAGEQTTQIAEDIGTFGVSRAYAVAPPPPAPPPVAGGEMTKTLTIWVEYALAK